jgi:hypothetical protein
MDAEKFLVWPREKNESNEVEVLFKQLLNPATQESRVNRPCTPLGEQGST